MQSNRRTGLRNDLGAAAIIALLVGSLYLPCITQGKLLSPSGLLLDLYPWAAVSDSDDGYNPMLSDAAYMFDPWHLQYLRAIERGEFPLWSPDNYCGVPLAANYQSSIFFPLHWLAWIFPVMWTFTLASLIKLWITGWFTYLFLRRRGLGWTPSTLAAVGITAGGWMTVWMTNPQSQGAMALPILLWAVDVWLSGIRHWGLLAIAVATAVSWLGGHPEPAFHVMLTGSAYAIYRLVSSGTANLSSLLALGLAQLTGLLFAAVQLVPFSEYLLHSHALAARVADGYRDGISPSAIVTMLVPNFFGSTRTSPGGNGASFRAITRTSSRSPGTWEHRC